MKRKSEEKLGRIEATLDVNYAPTPENDSAKNVEKLNKILGMSKEQLQGFFKRVAVIALIDNEHEKLQAKIKDLIKKNEAVCKAQGINLEEDQPEKTSSMKDMGNFRFYLPGGFYRENVQPDSPEAELINKIDELLPDFPIDFKTFNEKISRGGTMVTDAFKLAKLDYKKTPEAEKIGRVGDKIRENALEMIYPLFLELIELGYDEELLIG